MSNPKESELSDALERAILRVMRSAGQYDGVVVAVNKEKFACDVKLSDSTSNSIYYSVPLRVLKNSQASVIEIPKVGTNCILGFRDSNAGRPQLMMIHEAEEIRMTGKVVFNGGTLGGMVKAVELKNQSNKDKAILDALLQIINGSTITEPGNGQPSAFQLALKAVLNGKESGQWDNLENEKITQ
jgi:hypothetical protein